MTENYMSRYADGAANIASRIFETALKLKENEECILVFPHKSVDGDCIGSSCATVSLFRALGVKAWVLMPEQLPENMAFLSVDDLLYYPQEDFREDMPVCGYRIGAAMSVDCSEGHRMGSNADLFDSLVSTRGNTMSIDHHEVTHLRDDYKWIEPKAASASELVFYAALSLADKLGRPAEALLDSRAAQCILTGIVTDTGRFTYSNTSPETLISAGKLMEMGGNISEICYNLFDRKKPSQFMISNRACVDAELLCGGRLAIAVVTYDMFEKYGASSDDIADVVSRLRDIDGVDLAVVLREAEGGVVRGNLRSTEAVDCSALAGEYGGGGHKRAAGFTVKDRKIEEIRLEVIKKADDLLC